MWDKRQRGYGRLGYRIAETQTVMQVLLNRFIRADLD